MERFDGKVVIVTGAAQGLGLVTTKMFLEQGADVIATDINADLLHKEIAAIGSSKVVPFVMDVALEEDWKKLVDLVKEKYGTMDVLINNAAIIPGQDILKMSFEMFKKVVATNLDSVFLGMKYCHEVLKKGAYSSIVNISSIGGIKAGPSTGNDAGYNSSKAAVRNLTKHAAWVFAPDCIRVNSVHPAGINTEMRKAIMAADPSRAIEGAKRSPLPPHCSEPEDVARVILFLAGTEPRTMTGAELVVDNGNLTH